MALRKRTRELKATVKANTLVGCGWTEDVMMNAPDGIFQARGWLTAPTDGVSFVPYLGARTEVDFQFGAFEWIQRESRANLDEAVIAKHAAVISLAESPDHLVGCVTRVNAPSSELLVILPLPGACERWLDMFRRAGVKVLPDPSSTSPI